MDREAIRLIAICAGRADLRLFLMIARITSELERIGDQAVANCEYARLIGDTPTTAEFTTRADFAQRMVHDAVTAFADEDPRQAEAVMKLDDEVDATRHEHLRRGLLCRGRRRYPASGR